jgi:parallel beta-helix repeat protein
MNMKRKELFVMSLTLFIFFLSFQATCHSAILCVKPDGNDANSGASWALAKKTVQAAINSANEGDEIWVAAGAYAEHIKNKTVGPQGSEVAVNMALYGGFVGTETARDQRNWNINMTVLDGGGASSPTVDGAVVIIDSLATQATRIDGFVITRGHGFAAGGIFISGSGPVITNNIIRGNLGSVGGGILISNYKITPPQAHPVILNNTIIDNHAVEAGGGIAIVGSERIVSYNPVSPLISQNYITRNLSEFHGGGIGIYGHAAPQINNNYIIANTAAYSETYFMGNGGGIYATSRDVDDTPLQFTVCAPVIVSNIIAANGANFGGGIHLWDTIVDHGGIPVVINNTVVGNNGTGMSWLATNPIIQNNLVAYNTRGLEQGDSQSAPQSLRSNLVYGNELWEKNTNYIGLGNQTGINGNISTDPKMANYKIGNFRLQAGSPCIDAGYSAAIGSGWTDIEGQARIIGSGVDIGADESDGSVGLVPSPIYHVRPNGNDSQNGLSWATAKKTVSAAIADAQNTGGEIWVAAGTYVERNVLPAFIYLYGGFAGTETDRDSRNIVANPSILDGGGGQPTVVNSLYAGYFLSAIDGFTIQNGGLYTGGSMPTGTQGYKGRGAGIYCQVTSPIIQNNTIRRNSLGNPFDSPNKTGYGAGIYTYLSYAIIQNNTITENEILNNNSATGSGGGIYFFRSMPTILQNTITNNRAISGSAIYGLMAYPRILGNIIENNFFYNTMPPYYMGANQGAITLAMCWDALIEGNRIKGNLSLSTGAMGGGITVTTQFAGRIQNNLIQDNIANGMGGGIYAQVPLEATSSLSIVNNTIVGNTGTYVVHQGGGIAVSIPPPIFTPPYPIPDRIIIANNIIAFNSSGIYETLTTPMVYPTLINNNLYSNPGGNYISATSPLPSGPTDIYGDPSFVNRLGGDYHLSSSSPCINAGSNSIIPPSLNWDFEGDPRIINGVVDIGADEYTSIHDTTPPTVVIATPTNNPTHSTNQPVINIGGTASDNVGITSVTWSNNRGGNGTCDGTSSWSATSISLLVGENIITVTARDREPNGNTGNATLTVTYNPPSLKKPLVDFDSDGRTDIAVYRSSTGAWYVSPSGGGSPYGMGWGGDASDKPVPGDYDGDGKTDIAVYRSSTGAWYIYPSGGASPYGVGWGGDGTDKPVPGDYDGDGKTDIAIYRTSTGAWYVRPSGGGSPYGFGWGGDANDKPAPGDYDGDGKTDIAVYRSSTGAWYVSPTGGGSPYGIGWGGDPSDKPVPGDYDGDGKTDIAVYRTSIGAWYVSPSGGGAAYGFGWGGDASDEPAPGDYDGDGKTDIAVYRTNTGAWYVKPSSGATPYGVGWGGDASDKPVTMNLSAIE